METALFTLTSSLHRETVCKASEEPFIQDIEKAYGESFLYCGDDFTTYGTHVLDVIYVRTGGTEALFNSLVSPRLSSASRVLLLTSGQSNSLAASMEILAFLRRNGLDGEILHGAPSLIASRLRSLLSPSEPPATSLRPSGEACIRPLPPIDLGGIRLGVIGHPSDWLIASDVSYSDVRTRLNADLIDIPMSELLSRINCPSDQIRTFKGSEAIYDALKALIQDYRLNGLTLRCFDLLDTVHNTGCLALARLNAEGIPSSCEGDIPALLTMAWLHQQTGCPGFQCNLSRIDGDTLLFAHCTIPLTMVTSYTYSTHFESGLGTAIKGELPLGNIRIVKISPSLDTYVSIPGRILSNTSHPNLCRTQILISSPSAPHYLLHTPLSNHHIISLL